MPPRRHRLSTEILAATVVILLVTMGLGFGLVVRGERGRLDRDFAQRAAAIAVAVASQPSVGQCLARPDEACRAELERVALETAARTGASYVVVIDMQGVRFTHPRRDLVGQRVAEPIVTADGRVHTGADEGATGRSANGKAPLYAPSGAMVGEVSVGIQEQSVSDALWRLLPSYGLWFLCALVVGAVASGLLAARLKRQTFGLELSQISRLLVEREATLHGIREGVVAFDDRYRLTVVNDEARRLTGLSEGCEGRPLSEVLPDGPLLQALTGEQVGENQLVVTDDVCLVTNRMPVSIGGQPHGQVVTLRDQTEIVQLAEELNGQRDLANSMRAQQHEYANSMHVVAGLLELGEVPAALDYLHEVRLTAAEFDLDLQQRIHSPQVVGLLLGKAAQAHELGIELVLDPASHLGVVKDARTLVTVVGNLVDNAFEALRSSPAPRSVEVLVAGQDPITVCVSDNGPGVDHDMVERIFEEGVTSKASGQGGTGLALVKRLVTRRGGTVAVSDGPGARFTVTLPAGVEGQDG